MDGMDSVSRGTPSGAKWGHLSGPGAVGGHSDGPSRPQVVEILPKEGVANVLSSRGGGGLL